MYQLVFILSFWMGLNSQKSSYQTIIIDDCTSWEMGSYSYNVALEKSSKGNRFNLIKEFKYHVLFLRHFWIEENERLEELTLPYSEILGAPPLFSSDLTLEDWTQLGNSKKKIYVLLPSDYCSAKRFDWNTKFIVYEMHIDILSPDD